MRLRLLFLMGNILFIYLACAQDYIQVLDTLFVKHDTIFSKNGFYIVEYQGENVLNYRFFFSSSELSTEYSTINGKKNGKYIQYYKSGKIHHLQQFLYGVPVGVEIKYFENGNVEYVYDHGFNEEDRFLNETVIIKLDSNETPPFDITDNSIRFFKS